MSQGERTSLSPAEFREQQIAEFEQERESLEAHIAEARKMAGEMLRGRSRILIIDVSEDRTRFEGVEDEIVKRLVRDQFGGGGFTHDNLFKHILGYDISEQDEVDAWQVWKDPKRKYIPYPDAWIATGGPAMPSELQPGSETRNTEWLNRAVRAIHTLEEAGIPGLAICLGNQLHAVSRGARVGRLRDTREFGTVKIKEKDDLSEELKTNLQLLYGFWDDNREVGITASHSEGILELPNHQEQEYRVIAFNDYSPFQMTASSRKGVPLEEAAANDEVTIGIQNHPEGLAVYLEVLKQLRGESMRAEGLDTDSMFFKNTPNARKVFLRFLEMVSRRLDKRK